MNVPYRPRLVSVGSMTYGRVDPPARRLEDWPERASLSASAALLRAASDRVRASAWWSCERCGGEALPADLEVIATGAGLELRVRVPGAHRGHALTLKLSPVEPEP